MYEIEAACSFFSGEIMTKKNFIFQKYFLKKTTLTENTCNY